MCACVTDPTCPAEEQPDSAFLSETGDQAAPRPRHQHGRTGMRRSVRAHDGDMTRDHYGVGFSYV